jgi:FkbM family methyltransferase
MRPKSISNLLKQSLQHALRLAGLEIRRVAASSQVESERHSLLGVLQQAQKIGFRPATVIDVGAAYGDFTSHCRTVFPEARYLLIEPLQEYVPSLQAVIAALPNAEYVTAAAADRSGTVVLNVHPDLVGSSLYKEDEDSDVNGVERTVPAVTLDGLCQAKKTHGPYLLKIDTQGAELQVLAGAETIFPEIELIMLEVSLFEFFQGGPLLADCVVFMKEKGFLVYEMFDFQYRLLDGAMSQVDIAFVKEQGDFRKFHWYATREQRKQQNQRFRGSITL